MCGNDALIVRFDRVKKIVYGMLSSRGSGSALATMQRGIEWKFTWYMLLQERVSVVLLNRGFTSQATRDYNSRCFSR